MSRQATASEKKYMGRVSALSCACCGRPGPSQVHHIRDGVGMAQRAAHWLTIPLCPACHGQKLGGKGVHGDKSLMRIYEVDEMSMLATTIQKMVNL